MPTRDYHLLSPKGIPASQLEVGRTYFSVAYTDKWMVMPVIDSLVFIGRDLRGKRDGTLYFQDAASHERDGPMPLRPSGNFNVVTTEPEPPPNLFDIDGVIDELSRCLARRNERLSAGKSRGRHIPLTPTACADTTALANNLRGTHRAKTGAARKGTKKRLPKGSVARRPRR